MKVKKGCKYLKPPNLRVSINEGAIGKLAISRTSIDSLFPSLFINVPDEVDNVLEFMA